MARIDVSFLLKDPDFVNSISIVRRTTTVNDFGENELTEETISAIASVQAADGKTLLSLPETARLEDYKNIYTKTKLIADETGKYSDIIIWEGNRYQLIKIYPWGNFGQGWYKGLCKIEKVSL